MTTTRKVRSRDRRAAGPIRPGIKRFLLGEPIDPNADNRGLLETFRHSRVELLHNWRHALTPSELNRAMRNADRRGG